MNVSAACTYILRTEEQNKKSHLLCNHKIDHDTQSHSTAICFAWDLCNYALLGDKCTLIQCWCLLSPWAVGSLSFMACSMEVLVYGAFRCSFNLNWFRQYCCIYFTYRYSWLAIRLAIVFSQLIIIEKWYIFSRKSARHFVLK